jgi:hypothetical protein
MPERTLAVVLLGNRGSLALSAAGHAVLRELAQRS